MRPKVSTVPQELKLAVVQFYEDYAETLDDLDLEAWPDYFTDDCKYTVTSRENHDAGLTHATIYCEGIGMVRDRVAATRDCTVYEPRHLRHFLHGVRIHAIDGDVIRSKGSFLLIESVSDKEPCVHMVGRYHDTLVRSADGFKLKERICVYDNYRIYNSLIFPV